jgi:hypothetical protein
MITIKIDERTKAGRVLVETVRMMANKYSGIHIVEEEDDEVLEKRMKENDQSDLLSEDEKKAFLDELHRLSE